MHHTFIQHRFTTESYSTVISDENIKSQGVIATQKHQLPQQPITHSCPVRPHEQPTEAKCSINWSWRGRGWKYFRLSAMGPLPSGPLARSVRKQGRWDARDTLRFNCLIVTQVIIWRRNVHKATVFLPNSVEWSLITAQYFMFPRCTHSFSWSRPR